MSRSNKDRTEATRTALLDHARRLFVEKGYADTATPDIVAAAGVTRGALYHHFADKKALFQAVAEREGEAVSVEIETRSSPSGSARDALLAGSSAYFDAMAVPGRTRLLLLDGPAVMGMEGAKAIDRDHAEGSLRRGLEAYLNERGADLSDLSQLVDMLSAAFDRAAMAIASGCDRAPYERSIIRLIDGLAIPPRR